MTVADLGVSLVSDLLKIAGTVPDAISDGIDVLCGRCLQCAWPNGRKVQIHSTNRQKAMHH